MLLVAVLGSALLHAAWNALLRGHPARVAGSVAVVAIAALVAVAVAAIHGGLTGAAPFSSLGGLGASALAGLAEAGYFAALTRGLAIGRLGPVYTISRGGAVLLVWPVSVVALGEPLGALSLAGSAVLLGGLLVSGMERAVARPAVGWALITATCIAAYHLTYKVALGTGAAPPAVFAVALLVALPVQAMALRVRAADAIAAVRGAPAITCAAGVLCAASFLVFLVALRGGGAGAVLTLRNTSVVFAIGFGLALGEHPTRRQILGAVLVAGGAALVGLQG